MQERNYIGQVLGLTGLVTAAMLTLSLVSKKTTFLGFEIRKMDILSDIKAAPVADGADSTLLEMDTLSAIPMDTTTMVADTSTAQALEPQVIARVDSTFFGQQIEDYTPQQHGLRRFWTAIDSIRSHNRTVRIAFFGDSFVEGDILVGDLRDTLQSLWGGDGVGFVPLASEVARFRRTFVQDFKGWRSYSIIHPEGNPKPLGINGFTFIPDPDARVHYKGTPQYYFRHTRAWGDVRFFYEAQHDVNMNWQIDNLPPQQGTLKGENGAIKVWKHSEGRASISEFTMRFPETNGLVGYGMSLENGPGIYIDNFSVRGNSGGRLGLISANTMQQFDQYQHYDLVILQYGLNAVTNSTRNVKWYQAELQRTYTHIRQCFPNTPILIIGVPDRGGKDENGELTTMRGVPAITNMQRDLARQHGFLFYDFYHGMGGSGSMVRLAMSRNPRLANLDYTHLTHEGGRLIGIQMAYLLLREQQRDGERVR